jgi:hypothetical protein
MSRALLALTVATAAAVAAAACSSPATPGTQAPISNAVTGAPAPPCELGWIEHADELIVIESSDGHFGFLEYRAELRARSNALAGTVRASYKRYPDQLPVTTVIELRLPRAQIAAVLAAIARAALVPEKPSLRGRVSVHDTSQSRALTVQIAAQLGGVTNRARLVTDQGQIEPQRWSLVGCERKLSYDALAALTVQYGKLEQLLRRNELLDALEKRTTP